jgi:4,5-DOPA dioxygenase extradiol
MTRQPALFVSHGSPMMPLLEMPAKDFLRTLGPSLGRPNAILMVSAHWDTERPAVSAAERPETIYDFYGFPPALYQLRYPAPGAPQLAEKVARLLKKNGLQADIDPDRGLDHGAWSPLLQMYPEADIPVTQLSIQSHLGPAHHLKLGEALRPLRDEGVMILASGGATHNQYEGRRNSPVVQPWVVEFIEWLAIAIQERRLDDLVDYRARSPYGARGHPTDEHFIPLFVALGAGGNASTRLHTSVASETFAMDAYRFD